MSSRKSDAGDERQAEEGDGLIGRRNEAVRLIEKNQTFAIGVHVRPDPDAIGSALALARGLRQLGKRAIVISEDGVPDICCYLPDASTVLASTDERGFDVGVVCDANELDRLGTARDIVSSARSLLVLDHHPMKGVPAESDLVGKFSEVVYFVAGGFSSTAEVVWNVLMECKGMQTDPEMARQLMAGIVGDTGAFRFPNVTYVTLLAAAGLVIQGGSAAEAAREIYENRSLRNAKLTGAALLSLQVSEDGRIAWSHITRDDFARFDATDADTDSIVNQVMATKGVEVGALFHELEANLVRVGLRSRDEVDVNEIARKFGGGGHAAAAGCTIEASLEEAEKAVLAEVRACMGS